MKIYIYTVLAIVILSQTAVFFIDFTPVQAMLIAGLITCCSAVNVVLTYRTDFSKQLRFPRKTIRLAEMTIELTNLRVACMGLILALFGVYCFYFLRAKEVGLIFMAAGVNYISFSKVEARKVVAVKNR